ncbi:MAG: lysylphosphatidylglycerol synthase transmembrane domain-containing protein [Chloroflexota bacterium]|nr:lysylphosphatidylglycerol synthase transmembrane domain-containing protein [Chloroflexota bacterium]
MSSTARKLLLVVFLVCLVFAGVAGYGDFQEVWRRMSQFPPLYLLWAFGLALINYLLRFLRWAFYLKILRINLSFPASLLVFLGGLAMTITPGKVGELVKCYLLRDRASVPVAASVPVVLMERVTDLVSVGLMGLLGLFLLPPLLSTSLLLALAVVAAALYVLSTRHTDRALGLPLVRRWQAEIREARQGIRALSRPGPMTAALILGLVSWISEGVALWVVLKGLGTDMSVLLSLPVYAGSVLIGAATTLPGGLLGTEGAMVAILQQIGAERDVAAAGTLIVRVATLWFAVVVGLGALGILHWILPVRDVNGPVRGDSEDRTAGSVGEGVSDG